MPEKNNSISKKLLADAFRLMCKAKAMSDIYEEKAKLTSKYVHASSRGHEAVQIAMGLLLKKQDYLSAYYRDDAMLLSIGMKPYELMLQLFAKRDDPFSGGRTYYSHPSLRDDDKPKLPHQSSATGMQAIPATGVAMGIQYKEILKLSPKSERAIVVCSLGDASITEGEVAEAFQMADLKQLPILYLIQDNDWDISAKAEEVRSTDAIGYAKGFPGIKTARIKGSDFSDCYSSLQKIVKDMRANRCPYIVHADVPLLAHHTSGVRKEWYRDDLEEDKKEDPYPILRKQAKKAGWSEQQIKKIENNASTLVRNDLEKAHNADDPRPEDLMSHDFAPTTVIKEKGKRAPKNAEETLMVDCALYAIKELMEDHKECLLYGQDVGARLGGVFREAALLAQKFGDTRVFNTAIQEAFIVGSTVGMSAVGLKPIVEVQFADYIWPGLNQLFTEVSRSCYLSNGKWPVSMILRVPIGAYGNGGPYHSSSVESVLCNIKGIKIAYPSNGADLKGLMKAAYHDPNPVVMLEHKGLYWSKVKGTSAAKCKMPDKDYILPFGIGRMVKEKSTTEILSVLVVTYGMGVHWAENAANQFEGKVGVLDLRTLYPLDEDLIYKKVKEYNRCLVVTEEPVSNSFGQSIAARIQENCFEKLDAPVITLGAKDLPAVPLNETLEQTMIPSTEKVAAAIDKLLKY